jgi:hypothetical protein
MSFNSSSDKVASSPREFMRRRHSISVAIKRWRNAAVERGSARTFSDDETDCVLMEISRQSVGIYGRFHPSLLPTFASGREAPMTGR